MYIKRKTTEARRTLHIKGHSWLCPSVCEGQRKRDELQAVIGDNENEKSRCNGRKVIHKKNIVE